MRKSLTKNIADVRSMINTTELKLIDKHCDPAFLVTQAKLEIMSLERMDIPQYTRAQTLLKVAALIVLALDKTNEPAKG